MSEKLENALNAEVIDWDQVLRILRRLRGIKHIHMYMCRIVPECSLNVVSALMDHTRTKRYHTSGHLAQLISLIWTWILTGEDIHSNFWTTEDEITADHEMLLEWKETFLAAYKNWDKVGDGIRVPNIEKVVEALSKTALIVRALPRPMNAAIVPTTCKISKHGNSKVRITQNPTMPIVHFFVFQNLPPILIYIAALVYPEQLGQRDPWGNIPLHYANLSATEWTTWRPKFIPFTLEPFTWQSASPLINLNLRGLLKQNLDDSKDALQSDDTGSIFSARTDNECGRMASSVSGHDNHDNASSNSLIQHLVHETAVHLLVTLRTQSIQTKCHAGRIPLQTYLLSLLDYRRQESQKYHTLPYHPGTTWHFIQNDVELYLQHYPASVRVKDPQLQCLPFLYPTIALGSRKDGFYSVVQENMPVGLLVQETVRPMYDNALAHGRVEQLDDDDDQLRASPKPKKVVQDPFLDALAVSLTYRIIRCYPQICETANQSATEGAMWSMYERELHNRWKAKTRKLEDLVVENKALEFKVQELLETNQRIKSTQR